MTGRQLMDRILNGMYDLDSQIRVEILLRDPVGHAVEWKQEVGCIAFMNGTLKIEGDSIEARKRA